MFVEVAILCCVHRLDDPYIADDQAWDIGGRDQKVAGGLRAVLFEQDKDRVLVGSIRPAFNVCADEGDEAPKAWNLVRTLIQVCIRTGANLTPVEPHGIDHVKCTICRSYQIFL